MRHLYILAWIFLAALPAIAQEQQVEVILKDGTLIRGELTGPRYDDQTGEYVLKVDGVERRIADGNVASIKPTSLPAPKVTDSGTVGRHPDSLAARQERIRELLRTGDYAAAMTESEELIERLEAEQMSARNILIGVLQRDLGVNLAAARAGEVVASFRRATGHMNDSQIEATFNTLMAAVERAVAERPTYAFTQELTVSLAMEAVANERVTELQRDRLRAQIESLADALERARAYADAVNILRQAEALFPGQRDALARSRVRIHLAHGRSLIDAKDFDAARDVLARLRNEFPGNADANTQYDTARLEGTLARASGVPFEQAMKILRDYANDPAPAGLGDIRAREHALVREKLNRTNDVKASISILTEYLGQSLPENFREWAMGEMVRLQAFVPAPIEPAAAQEGPKVESVAHASVEKYHPVAAGDRRVYARAGDNARIVVRTISVEDEDGVARARSSLEEADSVFAQPQYIDTLIADDEVFRMVEGTREVMLKFPMKKGDTWSWASANMVFTRTVVSVHASVTVPAAIFKDCLEIEFSTKLTVNDEPMTFTSRSFYAPDVGLVKLAYDDPNWKGQSLELVEYSTSEDASKEGRTSHVEPPSDDKTPRTPNGERPKTRVEKDD